MLFKRRFYPGLQDGSIDLTFRRWSRAQAKEGGRYKLAGTDGVLVVKSVRTVAVGEIPPREIRRAGFADADDLRATLRTGGAAVTARTRVYRVVFTFEQEAVVPSRPRNAAEIAALVERLARMDRLGRRGPWTRQVLELLARHPQRRAGDLAPQLDRELRAFKADVRKLKAMGLTKSFEVGYELTPLGRKVLHAMKRGR